MHISASSSQLTPSVYFDIHQRILTLAKLQMAAGHRSYQRHMGKGDLCSLPSSCTGLTGLTDVKIKLQGLLLRFQDSAGDVGKILLLCNQVTLSGHVQLHLNLSASFSGWPDASHPDKLS